MYQNYIFDFYGTLVDIRTNESKPYLWKKMSELYSSYGAVYTAPELRTEFRRLEKESLKTQAEREDVEPENAEPNLTEVFAQLYHQKNVPCGRGTGEDDSGYFSNACQTVLYPFDDVKELLEDLRALGKGVYLLSNAQTDFTRPEIDMMGLTSCFDGIFISSEEGRRKPSPVFFERLLEKFGLDPSVCIMIGNDETADIAGANAVGMDSLYIHTAVSPKVCGRAKPTYCVMDGDFRKIRQILNIERQKK